MRNQALISLVMVLSALYAAWKAGGWISEGSTGNLEYSVLGLAVVAIAVTIVRSWRSGFYFFIVWLVFEDLFRKYLGNNMTIYFAKDVLAGLTCISLLVSIQKGRAAAFRPPFLLPLSFFFWLGVLQVFNPYSPNILYGLLGLKLYFYYIPLMFVGYALIRDDEDVRKFLVFNLFVASVIALLGIVQAIRGPTFLNPQELAPELRELGTLKRTAPISGVTLTLPTSAFVSTGRYGSYLILACILGVGAAAYLLLYTKRGRTTVFASIALIAVAIALSGARSAVVFSCGSVLVLGAGFIWGAPWRWRQVKRIVKAVRRSLLVVAIGLGLLAFIFPAVVQPRWAFYSETLSPESSASEVGSRAWDYPITNLMFAFAEPNWVFGNGIGTASLGVQYVSQFLGQRPPAIGVESGYGTLIVELGILGPFLWLLWTVSLLVSGWKVVWRLKQTRYFPVAFAIVWFAFLLLFPFTYGGLAPYQNYVFNAYLWLLVGILFRLPELARQPNFPAVVRPRTRRWLPW